MIKIGQAVQKSRGKFSAHKYLILRRISQLGILFLFLLAPAFDIWIVKGNLSSSLTLDILPLTDPFVLLQSFFAGHLLQKEAIIGAIIVVLFYLVVGGRAFCSWVCPVNIITDSAAYFRRKFRIKTQSSLSNKTRYYLLIASLIASFLTGSIIWELVNPVSILHRGIIFGMSFGWGLITLIFLFDLLVVKKGWCSRICPVGGFYGLIGKISLLKINAKQREKCTDCLECYIVCPEPQVINPALKGEKSTIILDSNCTNCARCIDVCEPKVFEFSSRFKK